MRAEPREGFGDFDGLPRLVGRDLGAEFEVPAVVVVGHGCFCRWVVGWRCGFGFVGTHQGPFRPLALDQGHAHGHFGVG